MKLRYFLFSKIFWFSAFFFVFGQFIGITAAYQIIFSEREELKAVEQLLAPEISWGRFLLAFLLASFLLVILLKVVKGTALFDAIFNLALASGIFVVLMPFFPIMISGYLTFLILILYALFPRIWIHNLFITLGLAGISVNLGLRLSIFSALIILAAVSLYDWLAVYKTKHMVKMFQGLLQRGIVLSLVIPQSFKSFKTNLNLVKPGRSFMFLGTGDLAFPLIFAVAAIKINFLTSIFISLGGLVGVLVMQFLFLSQKERRPLPALPIISFFSILGYLFSSLV